MSKQELTLVEATALSKLADKLVDAAKKNEKLEPGNYSYDFTVQCDGSLSRGADTKVSPPFKMDSLLKAVILRYAQTLDDPQEWLESLLDIDGALGAVVQLGPQAVLKLVKPELEALWNDAEAKAKDKHKAVAEKTPRAGNTSVVGAIEKVPNYQGDLAER